jgi:hypothetical protein
MYSFSHLHLKCYNDPKKFFVKNIKMGIKKTQNFMLVSNSLVPAFKNAAKKVNSQKNTEKAKNREYSKISYFFGYSLF